MANTTTPPSMTTITVVESCRIPPSPGGAAELSLRLSFMDMLWLHGNNPIRQLIFYEHPCSNADFFDTIVPNLKQSLSLTLKHYLPVAANLLYPLDTQNKPVIRYLSGDSIPLTIAVSGRDLDELTGNHARDSDQFYEFMPQIPPLKEEGGYKIVPLIALQATLFPGRGICIGVSIHHCLGDARSVFGFMSAWASMNKISGDDDDGGKFLCQNSLPFLDRSLALGDSSRVDDIFWNVIKNSTFKTSSFPLPTNRVRASFTLHHSDIKKLKNLVLSQNPSIGHVSSFVVTTAYTWSCMVKSGGEEVGEDEAEVFSFPADGRGRPNALVDPPVPLNYFGNFLGGGMVSMEHKKIAADEGFVAAAEAIADQIKNNINNKDKFLQGTENWLSYAEKSMKVKTLGVFGSPKFDLSNADFGWGKPKSLEALSIDGLKYSMSLCNSKPDSDGGSGLVVGLSLPREKMEAFAAIFADGLTALT